MIWDLMHDLASLPIAWDLCEQEGVFMPLDTPMWDEAFRAWEGPSRTEQPAETVLELSRKCWLHRALRTLTRRASVAWTAEATSSSADSIASARLRRIGQGDLPW